MNIGYIKIALALLSVAGYVQNIAFASDSAPASNPSNEESKQQLFIDPEEAKQQLFIDPEEAKQAADVMADALALAQEHAQNTKDYKLYYKKDDEAIIYFKNFKDTVIGKLELIVPNPDSYDGIINMLMDPNGPKKIYNTFDEEDKQQLFIDPEEAKQQLFIDPEEAKQAADVMADALALAQEHAQNTKDYKLYYKKDDEAIIYFKNFKDTVIGKLELIVPNPDSYDGIINMLMDPNGPKKIYNTFDEGTLSRIYDPNLLIVRQQYKSIWGSWQRHFYALVNKVESSEDETAIIMVSLDVNDYNNEKYKIHVNPIVESANLFKPDINSQEDIRNKESKKMYINLVTFFIKKEENCVKVTFVGSIDMNAYSRASQQTLRKIAAEDILLIAKLRNIFKKE
ncbi:fam-a protein [Plasmodium chabaudi adami]|uniref:Fam-a protein n=1 Tax=Plasmodium chabaudi adami TaxID=5826 RepID=A0A1D3LLQ6_PLACE|nr:fam-a protein [Plasmodium chabaudi adami]